MPYIGPGATEIKQCDPTENIIPYVIQLAKLQDIFLCSLLALETLLQPILTNAFSPIKQSTTAEVCNVESSLLSIIKELQLEMKNSICRIDMLIDRCQL